MAKQHETQVGRKRKPFDVEEAIGRYTDFDVWSEEAMPGKQDYLDLDEEALIGRRIWSRKIEGKNQFCGVVQDTSACRLEGCGGLRLHVKWADGRRTYPCFDGCISRGHDLEIG